MNKEIEELLPFYALDALTDEEREQVEAYLREHPEAREQVDELSQAASMLPESLLPIEPSKRTKDALMARVAEDVQVRSSAQIQPSRSMNRFESFIRTFTLAGAVLALVWIAILNFQIVNLRDELNTLGDALIAQSQSLQQINQQLAQVPPSSVVTISLNGTDIRPQAQGELIADPNSRSAVLIVGGLDLLEPGVIYQVWLIDGNGPTSAGLLAVDENGQGLLIVNSDVPINSFNALGISIEPEGGSPQPTGDIVILSDL